MKTIGIVGGLAWPSTVIYYRTINELVATRLGGLHCARLVLAQTDFEQVERSQREGRWDLVGDLLTAQACNLKAAGADFFLLACNTVHTASERIENLADLPFLHIVDPTARQIQQAGFTTVGLLGSRYTMTGTYFAGRLRQRYGLNVLVAEGEHQDNVHNALYAELAHGTVLPATRARFQAAITDLVTRGAEVIVLACTEFGMIVQAWDSPVPVIDTTIAHAQAAVEMALAGDPLQPRHLNNRTAACIQYPELTNYG
ncbi:MAG TPA: amino acid racemase [Streptosporangiaceae bacterium]|nr:amino acid racemase [Streptosporangiaceae bacterium]